MRERIADLMGEIATAARGRRASYVQVEEFEADLERVCTWLGKITARDYFGARGRAAAQADVDQCARALDDFEAGLSDRR